MNAGAEAEHDRSPSSPRRPRIAWRVAIGVLLVLGMAGGYWSMGRQKARKQHEAIQRLSELGGRVYLEYEWNGVEPVEGGEPPEARWVRRLLGDAMFDRAVAVDLRDVRDPEAAVAQLKWLPYIQHLDGRNHQWSTAQVARIGRLRSLVSLDLSGTGLSDEGVRQLRNLGQLQTLRLAENPITNACVPDLVPLKRLRLLDVSDTRLGVDGLRRLRNALPECDVRAKRK
jgi:hypothetical protein